MRQYPVLSQYVAVTAIEIYIASATAVVAVDAVDAVVAVVADISLQS